MHVTVINPTSVDYPAPAIRYRRNMMPERKGINNAAMAGPPTLMTTAPAGSAGTRAHENQRKAGRTMRSNTFSPVGFRRMLMIAALTAALALALVVAVLASAPGTAGANDNPSDPTPAPTESGDNSPWG